ncbi:STAS domain-containing protein [Maridesulfovibrio zosterae]|uniref:STAS domain-containing protein n=1 Tax=Maridesulfovibrio zosterae TaxID=82171 RepID=UPI0004109868|nr:STAS domain-containing protein [Maridesulfovibrio zosterae]
MDIKNKKINDVNIVGVKGRLDAITSTNFEEAVCVLINSGENKIVFDLSELEYISSAGLRAILCSAKRLKAIDGQIAFANINGMISEVFEISGFGSMFNIYSSALVAADKLSEQS